LELVKARHAYLDAEEQLLWAEFVLHGLAEHSRIGRSVLQEKVSFSDLFQAMLSGGADDALEEGDDARS
jgi:magnesium chelatase subunit I